jgi:protease-4
MNNDATPGTAESRASAPASEAPSAATAAAPAPSVALKPPLDSGLEQLARVFLQDRRSERRWRIFFRLTWLLVVLAVLAALFNSRTHLSTPSGPHTALVEVRGEIAADAEASAENIVAGLKSAFEEHSASAVVLRINSPGGSPVQAGIVYDELRRLKALHKKKVYAVVEESCASGAYYIAAAADEIYVDKASIVGSIGVLMDGFGATAAMEKLGIERRLLTAGENKGIGDPFSPLTDKHRAYLKAMLEQIHQQFIAVVKQGRGTRLKETPETFSGLFWNGEQAVAIGLADHLGSLDYVAREVVKAETVIDYTAKENVAERLAKRFGASIGAGAVRALHATVGLH